MTIELEKEHASDAKSTRLYLRDIKRVPLLTPQQETELAKRIKHGDHKARERMIRANLYLVVRIARDYDGLGMPLLDLIGEGTVGLVKAVERFDPARNAKMSAYASRWIKQAMRRALSNQSTTTSLPVHAVDELGQLKRIGPRSTREKPVRYAPPSGWVT
jgi:RNA polymerase primary sigma factor